MRRIGRALRHGLVVSGVCVLIALGTGVSGFVFGERTEAAYGQALPAPTRDPASTSQEVLGRWLKPLGEASTAHAAEAPAASEVAVPLEVVTVPSLTAEAAPSAEEGRITASRLAGGAVSLRAGDRPMVTVSFYYCEEIASYSSGDGGGFCGLARNGTRVAPGMAACDVAYLGQRFQIEGDPTGRTYLCGDTGGAVRGLHRDIWFMSNRDGWHWQQSVGEQAFIRVLP